MMIRNSWRYHDDDRPASRRFSTAVALVAAALFATVWVVVSAMLLGALALRFF
jgi:hypothetical protein